MATLGGIVGSGLGLAVLGAATVLTARPLVAVISAADGPATGAQAWAAASHTLSALAAAAAAVAVAQWGLARLRFERRIRMTPQEFADEAKSMQADPKVRLLQRQRRRAG
jgi:flagellar biosynthesis protein FlhB